MALPTVPRKAYPSDLTDEQWALLEIFVKNSSIQGPNPAKYSRREIINALLYVKKTGCQWRYLPHDFPDWQTVYDYFRLWKRDGTWKKIHDTLRTQVRKQAGRKEAPSAAILDSQTVKTTEEASYETRGYDGGKKIKGRKRHVLVDVLGLVLAVLVTTASVTDRDGARQVLATAHQELPSVQHVWADRGYEGPLVEEIKSNTGITLEIVKRTDTTPGFVVQKWRWIVERTFGWMNRDRRLSKDYERLPESSEAWIYLSGIGRMIRKLAPQYQSTS